MLWPGECLQRLHTGLHLVLIFSNNLVFSFARLSTHAELWNICQSALCQQQWVCPCLPSLLVFDSPMPREVSCREAEFDVSTRCNDVHACGGSFFISLTLQPSKPCVVGFIFFTVSNRTLGSTSRLTSW